MQNPNNRPRTNALSSVTLNKIAENTAPERNPADMDAQGNLNPGPELRNRKAKMIKQPVLKSNSLVNSLFA